MTTHRSTLTDDIATGAIGAQDAAGASVAAGAVDGGSAGDAGGVEPVVGLAGADPASSSPEGETVGGHARAAGPDQEYADAAADHHAVGDHAAVDPVVARITHGVEQVSAALERIGRSDDVARLGDRDLTRLVRQLRRLEGLATTHLALAVRAAQRSGAARRQGASSPTEWLTASGRSGREAARLVRLGGGLDDLPGTRAALADGDLTAEGADVLVRAATDGRLGGPGDVERDLLDTATSSTPDDLRVAVRRRQQAVDGDALLRDERRQHLHRRVSLVRGGDGMWKLSGELSGEQGARLRTALDAFDHRDGPDVPRELRRTAEQRLADAVGAMVDTVLDRGLAPSTGGVVRPHLTAIVDAEVLRADLARVDAGSADGGDRAIGPGDDRWADLAPGETTWGDVLSPQAIRRVLCDAAVSRVVLAGEAQPLDVGRTRREWSAAQRRAVNARDRACRGPGCTRPIAWTQVHHVRWWSNHGETSVDNGLALCHHCHRLVHDVGWTVHHDLETATATWTSPEGTVIATRPRARVGARDPASAGEAGDTVKRRPGGPDHPTSAVG